jgi:hypothetical protein
MQCISTTGAAPYPILIYSYLGILAFDVGPSVSETKLLRLEKQVCVLPARDFVEVDIRRPAQLTRLKWSIQRAHVFPV